ncbi:MAG: ComEC/Rec2 family competence protein [bacterium]|nr:ComEC/Rec2 family competence protein [bacterium]
MRAFVAAGLFAAFLLAVTLWSEVLKSPSLELAFLDVKQGDAIYVETPHGHQMLIDGGPDATVLSRLGEVMPFYDKSIDLLVVTHPDADHITGLVSVLESFEVQTVVWTGKANDTRVFAAFAEALENEGANLVLAEAGQEIVFGDSGAILEILYPKEGIDIEGEASNETSIISRLRYGGSSVLLPGDTTQKIERRLLKAGTDLKSDILKVAHHGSRTSSAPEFLLAVGPEDAVISVGKGNRFGHPAQETLVNLAGYGMRIHRTDEEGTILFYLK